MDMCYDGALVLPSSYAIMEQEEMTYFDGGTAKTFKNNVIGLWNKGTPYRRALTCAGFNYRALLNCAVQSYNYCVLYVAAKIGVSIGTINAVVGAVFAAGTIVAGAAMWNKPIFY